MTLRTVTYDDATHKVVPLEPTHKMLCELNANFDLRKGLFDHSAYRAMIAAAPEFKPNTVSQADIDQCNKDF